MAQHETTETKDKLSIWGIFGKIGRAFGFIFSILTMILGLVVATPFFLLSVLINWIKMSVGFAVFWVIAYIIYDTIILNNASLDIQPFNNTVILSIVALGLIASIFVTVADMKE